LFNKFFDNKEIKQLKALVQSMPNDPGACFNLGAAYQKLGRYKDAVREFEKTLKYNPMSAEAHYNLALIYENMNEGKKLLCIFLSQVIFLAIKTIRLIKWKPEDC